jgi:hypothetical protein
VTAVDLAARRMLAASVLTDYQLAAETEDTAGRAMWGARLADALQGLLAVLDAPAATPRPATPGPLETEQQARALPAVRAVYEAFDRDPGVGKMAPHNFLMLVNACEAAGVGLGSPASYDRQILAWLAGWEPATCAVVAGLITRAHAAGRDGLTVKQLATLGHALTDAIEWRDPDGPCRACQAEPGGLCEDHAGDVLRVSAYRQLAADLGLEAGT